MQGNVFMIPAELFINSDNIWKMLTDVILSRFTYKLYLVHLLFSLSEIHLLSPQSKETLDN